MTLGEKIQKLRKSCGLSQLQLAEQLDVSRQSVSKWVFIVKYKCRKLQTKNVGRCNYIL